MPKGMWWDSMMVYGSILLGKEVGGVGVRRGKGRLLETKTGLDCHPRRSRTAGQAARFAMTGDERM